MRPYASEKNKDIPLLKKLLLSIWILSTSDSFRSVADRFGLPKSTAHIIFNEILDILIILLPQYVHWPDADECKEIETVSIYNITK